jgi:site-specific DNA recombinase
MSNLKLARIGLYARVSSEKQAQEKTINSQIASIVDYVNTLGEKIDPNLHFIDDGISGAHLERPGLDNLRDKALSGEVTKVYILSPDRLSRKSAHQILLIEEMKRLGVDFHFVNREIGDTPEDQMLLQIQGVVAEYEREKIMERARRGKLYAAQNGKVNILVTAPYGYYYNKVTDTHDASYSIHPEEALFVKEAFALYCNQDYSIKKIARTFTEKGYITRTGKTHWNSGSIARILKNPACKGTAAYRKTKAVKATKKTKNLLNSTKSVHHVYGSRQNRPEEDWIYIPVPAIIDEKLFNLAKQKLQDNIRFSSRNNKKNKYLLTGMLRCKICNYTIYGKPCGSQKKPKLYYRCRGLDGYLFPEGKVCKGHYVRVEILDDLVWNSVKSLLLTPEIIVNEYQRRLQSHEKNHTLLIDQKSCELERYKRERDRLIDLFQSGLVEKEEISKKLKAIQSKNEQLTNEIRYLKKQDEESEKMLTVIRNLTDFSNGIKKNIETHTFEEKRRIIKLLVEEVEVNTLTEEVNVKHIIPIDPKWCQLRSNTPQSCTWHNHVPTQKTMLLP